MLILSALVSRVGVTVTLWARRWWEVQKTVSMSLLAEHSGGQRAIVSGCHCVQEWNGSLGLFLIVNWIEGSMSSGDGGMPISCNLVGLTVSSTYLFQNNGLWVQEESILSSTSSITRSATVTETGDPTAMLKVCWYHSPLYNRYVALS